MLYHLFEYFKNAGIDFPGVGLMSYLSFRAMLSIVTAMIISFFVGGKIINFLNKKQIKDVDRDLGKGASEKKTKSTPTMGGVIIILSIIVPVLLFCNLTNIYIQLLILTTLWCGGIGFADDYIKVFKHNKEGLNGKMKLLLQLCLGLFIGLAVCFNDNIVVREKVAVSENIVAKGETPTVDSERLIESEEWATMDMVKSTKTTIPFVKNNELDYKIFSPFNGAMGWYCKWAIYVLMIVLVIMACSNGANLTDGIDGLATGTSTIVGVVIGILAWLSGNLVNSTYLNIMYIPGTGEVAIFMAAFVGALIGFLWYNAKPAEIWMGDTGSLALGGIIGVSAILIRKELLLPLLCGIFFAESLSVLLQTGYFKLTKKKYGEGRRIFKMTPLHHHFQKIGNPALIKRPAKPIEEEKLVTRFWIVGIILAVATLALLKVR